MSNHWSEIQIYNYKSIKDLHLECGKINVFIGPPNSGKSNILEALEIPGLSYLMPTSKNEFGPETGFLDCKKFFRVDHARQLFRLGETSKPIVIEGVLNNEVKSFTISSNFSPKPLIDSSDFVWKNWLNDEVPFTGDFISHGRNRYSFFGQSYKFTEELNFQNAENYYHGELQGPYGINLGTTIRVNPQLQEFVREIIRGNGLDLVVDDITGRLSLQIGNQSGFAISLPFRALSDTFRRMIFYTAAIRTSLDSILILEEPEALSFPPYISKLASEIIQASSQKQFFINTHSPYIIHEFLDNAPKEDLAIFVCSYNQEERQTKARRLSTEELSEIQDFGIDLFFNLDSYLDEPEHSA
jgi:hypothetical protein